MTADTSNFYADIPAHNTPLSQLLLSGELFRAVPDDWHIIITDIKNSTAAVNEGRHENVNLIATGSIVCILNIAFSKGLTIPFFFGGDGATFLVPPGLHGDAMKALALYKINTRDNFNLDLRTGTIPVSRIYSEDHALSICKFISSDILTIPIVLGDGLSYAEQLIKGEGYSSAASDAEDGLLNLRGMQCRWDKIPPPEDKEEIATLLILAHDFRQQSAVFAEAIARMDEIYGSHQKRQPISIGKLRLKTSFDRLGREISIKLGKMYWFETLKTWATTMLGRVYFKTQRGQSYLKRLVEMSDTLVIDGKINTVISGTRAQNTALQLALDTMESEGKIIYGMHISKASVMSCYVRDMRDGHIHFVDGSEGGYTRAASVLKAKLQARKSDADVAPAPDPVF